MQCLVNSHHHEIHSVNFPIEIHLFSRDYKVVALLLRKSRSEKNEEKIQRWNKLIKWLSSRSLIRMGIWMWKMNFSHCQRQKTQRRQLRHFNNPGLVEMTIYFMWKISSLSSRRPFINSHGACCNQIKLVERLSPSPWVFVETKKQKRWDWKEKKIEEKLEIIQTSFASSFQDEVSFMTTELWWSARMI